MSLSHSNILQSAHQWGHFDMKKHLGATLPGTLYHMCKSGFYPNLTCVIPLRSAGMDVRCVTSIWKIKMDPNDIDMEIIYNIFFGTVMSVATMRYLNS